MIRTTELTRSLFFLFALTLLACANIEGVPDPTAEPDGTAVADNLGPDGSGDPGNTGSEGVPTERDVVIPDDGAEPAPEAADDSTTDDSTEAAPPEELPERGGGEAEPPEGESEPDPTDEGETGTEEPAPEESPADDGTDPEPGDDSGDTGDGSDGGGTIVPVDPGPSCEVADLSFEWPMTGDDAHDWIINNYVDLDTREGFRRDFMGSTGSAARTYDNHRGIDIDVASFRQMDGDFPIIAAAPGTVVALRDDRFDRNTSCSGSWNYVKVEHDNGFVVYYGHLKQDSVVVAVGQRVGTGDMLGVVGSSGCSTHPHLHFEVHDCADQVVDPFLEGMFVDPPVYVTPLGFMDIMLTAGGISSIGQIKDPAPNVDVIAPGTPLGVGMSMGGGVAGDSFSVRLIRSDGSTFKTLSRTLGQTYRHSFWYWNVTIDNTPGLWRAEVRTNGVVEGTFEFNVSTLGDDSSVQQVRHHIPETSYQTVFNDITAAGYHPVWVDGYTVGGDTYFNAVFESGSTPQWWAYHDLTGGDYQSVFNERVGGGARLVHVDSYLLGGQIRYAAIFRNGGGPDWVTYHGVSQDTHISLFNDYVGEGYRPVLISPLVVDGQPVVTALYDRAEVGSFAAYYGMDSAAYQSMFTEQTSGQGRRLTYLNAYSDVDGVPRFSAVWAQVSYGGWVARHNKSTSGFQSEFENWAQAPYYFNTRIVTGYDNGSGAARFAGLWTAE